MQTRLIDVPGAERQALAPEAPWHTLSAEEVLRAEEADPRHGLSSAEAASRADRFGPNTLAAGRPEPRWRAFIRQYSDPMQIVLLVVGLLSLYPLNQLGTGLLLILLTLANAVLGLQQEGEAGSAVAALQRRLIVTARVRRDDQEAEIPAEQLVPGDVVSIEAGDVVPADGRLLRAATLEVAESELTGESLPVSKGTAPVGEADMPLGDRTDMVYMNTSVTRGTGGFVVTATGMATEVGHISGMLQAQPTVKTPLTRQLDHLSKQLLLVAGVALIASMAVNLSRGYTFNAVLPVAVAFAIAAVPVQLPMVVTTILAWGTRALAKVGAIMKQLPSTETLGSTSAINTDKTGTLTLNQMTAVQMVVAGHRYAVEGKGYSAHGRINRVAGQAEIPLDQFLMPMVLASDAVLSDGELIGDPTEGALVALAAKGGIDAVSTRQVYPRIAELPFDAEYKLMATFHKMTDESGKAVIRCFVKGAPDQLLARAATVLDPDAGPVPLDGRLRERYLADNHRFAEEGLRVMATARRDFDPAAFDPGADLLPLVTDLELLALVGIVDPPRPGAKASVGQAKSAGIEVRMITGDHAVTAAAIARQLGIDGKVISGAEFGAMTDDEAMEAIADVGVLARVTPEHKVRLVDLLKREGQIVAMTGDGVNDAPALKKADIGIAMGETGTEVAKQAAVMVLTDDNFSTITKAVEIGRGLYDNLVRYIRFEMGCMFGFIITFLGASIFDIAHGEPLLPLQVLWVAFTTVTIQSIGLGYSRPVEGLMERRPRPPSQPIVTGGVLSWLVSVGLVMAIGTLSVVSWAEQAHTLAVARTMGVVVFSLFNLFFSIESRHRRESVFSLSTFADRTAIVTTGASLFLLVMATVLAPCHAILKTTALDVDQWLICAAVALSIIAATEIRKAFLRQTVGPVRLRRSPRRRLRHRCRVPARPGSRGLPRGAQRDPADRRHQLKELTADQLDDWLDERAEELSTRSLRLIHQIVERAIRQAQARDKVRRNVASLVDVPEGQEGRPSKAMTLGQAVALLETVESGTHRLAAYVVLSLLSGIRTAEAWAITWDEVDLKAGTVAVYRSVRVKGDTKTRKSRRVLKPDTDGDCADPAGLNHAADGGHYALVTVYAHNSMMRNVPDRPESGRVGALVIRVWLEGTADDPQLRIRLIGRQDVTRDVEETASASTIEGALVPIRDWLEQFSHAAQARLGRLSSLWSLPRLIGEDAAPWGDSLRGC